MAGFEVRDRRSSGLVVGQSVAQARQFMSTSAQKTTVDGSDEAFQKMRRQRRVASRFSKVGTASGQDVTLATTRPRDPMFYWRQNNLPYDLNDSAQLIKIRNFCTLLYQTHPVIPGCIDIYSVWPLQGMRLRCEKDSQIEDFYNSHFIDDLNYPSYFREISHNKWKLGEAFPLASFNESLGVWESDELMHPNDVDVQKSPFLREPRFLIRLPETLREIIQKQSPRWEYEELMREYPELRAYVTDGAMMPVSNMLMKQIAFKPDSFSTRGIPLLMRSFRSITQEEMLNAALDSIADRLYTPLILAKLGASATDLGTGAPWIPKPEDLDDFLQSMDAAMAADFRVMVHHFATEIESVFGRENMPDLGGDFDRIENRILKSFGISDTMLSGAESGETYAADALHMDVLTDLLTQHQHQMKRFYEDRAMIVAEAQEHYDFEVRNGRRYVKMEEILEYDEETGEERIIEQPKLLYASMEFDTLSLRDEQVERQFRETLVAAGVPISHKTRVQGTGMDLENERESRMSEIRDETLAEQRARKETYAALRAERLPIPEGLTKDFQPKAMTPADQQPQEQPPMAIPGLGTEPTPLPVLAPTEEDLAQGSDEQNAPPPQQSGIQEGGGPGAYPPNLQDGNTRPAESDEARWTMPRGGRRVSL